MISPYATLRIAVSWCIVETSRFRRQTTAPLPSLSPPPLRPHLCRPHHAHRRPPFLSRPVPNRVSFRFYDVLFSLELGLKSCNKKRRLSRNVPTHANRWITPSRFCFEARARPSRTCCLLPRTPSPSCPRTASPLPRPLPGVRPLSRRRRKGRAGSGPKVMGRSRSKNGGMGNRLLLKEKDMGWGEGGGSAISQLQDGQRLGEY